MGEAKTGGCLCGAVRFEVETPFLRMAECHCAECQKVSGGAPSYLVGAATDRFRIVKGAPRAYTIPGSSGAPVSRYFCETCGAPTHSTPEAFAGTVYIKVGAFDEDPGYRSEAAIWCASAPAWHHLPEGAPHLPRGSRG